MRVYALGILFLFLTNLLDVFYTHKVITAGVAEEFNPLMAWVIENYGFGGLAAFKSFIVVVIWALLLDCHKKLGRIPELVAALFWGSVFAYFLLTLYHLFIQVVT